jgi:site-specific DNA-adenine methylase
MITDLKAPFPYFGGKSTVADVIWEALGQPKHYIEPFAGSCAILLNRPDYNPSKHMETINDKDGYVANVWRSLQMEPDAVAKICDWPVNHADLNARRRYLLKNATLLPNLCEDPEWHDVTMAGYWIWAASCWIGSGLTRPGAMPDTTNSKGVHKNSLYDANRYPDRIGEKGVHKRSMMGGRPQVGVQGAGVHQAGQIPGLTLAAQTGINSQIPLLNHETGVCRRPCYGASGAHGVHKTTLTADPDPLLDVRDPYTPGLYAWFRQLSERLRRVRVVCGDWKRVCGGDWQDDRGTCGMAFDPPYGIVAGRDKSIYHEESLTVANEVQEWCRERGDRKTYRIILCGYLEEHQSLLNDGWTVHKWSAHGGFANRGNGKTQGEINRHKEAIFFSPHCHSSGLQRFMDLGMLSDEVSA